MGRSEHAARRLLARWQKAGWAEGRTILVGRPVFLWLTREGQRLTGLPYKLWRPDPGAPHHIEAVTEVRLYVQDGRPNALWVSERELARDQGRRPGYDHGHTPDGLVLAEVREAAVEVELTLKRLRPSRRGCPVVRRT